MTVALLRDGFYDVRMAPMRSGDRASIRRTEWHDGAWWDSHNGERLGLLTSDCTWRGPGNGTLPV